MIGKVFSRLTVIASGGSRNGKRLWKCRCECGVVKDVPARHLWVTQSCGCLRAEIGRANKTHGGSKGKEYCSWSHAKKRCSNPSDGAYQNYGARGIFMVPEWRSDFAAFLRDMGPCPPDHELDRINNDGPYAPGNCRWATRQQQMNNTRRTRFLEYEGRRLSLADWAREKGMTYHTLYLRLRAGHSVEHALSH